MVQIIKIDRSNRLGKRFNVILDNGNEYHFGQEFHDEKHPIQWEKVMEF